MFCVYYSFFWKHLKKERKKKIFLICCGNFTWILQQKQNSNYKFFFFMFISSFVQIKVAHRFIITNNFTQLQFISIQLPPIGHTFVQFTQVIQSSVNVLCICQKIIDEDIKSMFFFSTLKACIHDSWSAKVEISLRMCKVMSAIYWCDQKWFQTFQKFNHHPSSCYLWPWVLLLA